MLNDSQSKKFLNKIKKWGNLHPNIHFVLYTDHTGEGSTDSRFDYTVVAVCDDCFDLTQKLHWIDYFGPSTNHALRENEDNSTIEVDYKSGLKVSFVIFESNMPLKNSVLPNSKILVDKN